MSKRFPYQKLTLQDRYAGQEHIQTQKLVSVPYIERSTPPALPIPDLYIQGMPRRRKLRFWPYPVFSVLTLVIIMSGIYYVLMGTAQKNTLLQNLTSSIHIEGPTVQRDTVQRDTVQKDTLKQVIQTRISQLAKDVNATRYSAKGSIYQQKLAQDQAQFARLVAPKDDIALLVQVNSDLAALQGDLAGNNATTLLDNFQQEAQQWGDAHRYHDAYDGKNYYLNSSYLNMDGHNGIRYGESAYMSYEVNVGNSQAAQDIKDDYFQLSMLEANYEDATPFNQPHQVDQALLDYFGDQHMRVLIVSLTEQAIRIYNNGQLEQAFQVTTGREYRPTPIGHFQLTQHFHNYTLVSYDLASSPDYYAPVTVQNAIQFWENGYLIHSSQWRQDYGPFTQFPHRDSGGDPDASTGSHGCINVAPALLDKLASTITYQTPLIIF